MNENDPAYYIWASKQAMKAAEQAMANWKDYKCLVCGAPVDCKNDWCNACLNNSDCCYGCAQGLDCEDDYPGYGYGYPSLAFQKKKQQNKKIDDDIHYFMSQVNKAFALPTSFVNTDTPKVINPLPPEPPVNTDDSVEIPEFPDE